VIHESKRMAMLLIHQVFRSKPVTPICIGHPEQSKWDPFLDHHLAPNFAPNHRIIVTFFSFASWYPFSKNLSFLKCSGGAERISKSPRNRL
jgi:hypothetical protein